MRDLNHKETNFKRNQVNEKHPHFGNFWGKNSNSSATFRHFYQQLFKIFWATYGYVYPLLNYYLLSHAISTRVLRPDEGLTFQNLSTVIIYIIYITNSVDRTKLSCSTPPTKHRSFSSNLHPMVAFHSFPFVAKVDQCFSLSCR